MPEQNVDAMVPRKEWFSLQSPIGVIGGFAALVEIALILATIFVEGGARWALILFAAVAFIYVSTWFFWILTHKNWVLYPPKEYGGETGVTTYVEAMHYRLTGKQDEQFTAGLQASDAVQQIYAASVSTSHSPLPLPRISDSEGETDQAGLLVFMGPRRPDSLGLHVGIDAFPSVTECLSYIGNTLLPEFESDDETERRRRHDMNYGTTWTLRETKTQQALTDIGPRWALKQSGNFSDLRRLHEAGLKPGMHLELERFEEESLPISQLIADGERLMREDAGA